MTALSKINVITRRRPDLFILGFQKCGTTSIYKYLEHLDYTYPGLKKENDVLAWNPRNLSKFLGRYPFRWQSGKKVVCGSHLLGTSDSGAEVLRRHFPYSKVLFILRNPARRALSRYLDNKRKPQKKSNPDKAFPYTFHEMVRMESRAIPYTFNNDVKALNALDQTNKLFGGILAKGHYHVYLKEYISSHDTKVIFLEDLRVNFSAVMGEVMDWLGHHYSAERLHEIRYNQNEYSQDLYQEDLAFLSEYYAHSNERLSKLLNQQLPESWLP